MPETWVTSICSKSTVELIDATTIMNGTEGKAGPYREPTWIVVSPLPTTRVTASPPM